MVDINSIVSFLGNVNINVSVIAIACTLAVAWLIRLYRIPTQRKRVLATDYLDNALKSRFNSFLVGFLLFVTSTMMFFVVRLVTYSFYQEFNGIWEWLVTSFSEDTLFTIVGHSIVFILSLLAITGIGTAMIAYFLLGLNGAVMMIVAILPSHMNIRLHLLSGVKWLNNSMQIKDTKISNTLRFVLFFKGLSEFGWCVFWSSIWGLGMLLSLSILSSIWEWGVASFLDGTLLLVIGRSIVFILTLLAVTRMSVVPTIICFLGCICGLLTMIAAVSTDHMRIRLLSDIERFERISS